MAEKLWAPWRMAYVGAQPPPGCIFCLKPREDRDEANLILYRGERCFIMLNAFPYNSGHLMIVPYCHESDLSRLEDADRVELLDLAGKTVRALTEELGAEGHNLGINLGRVSGAGIADHLHLHVVPRWNGDTNFMPVLADVKVLPQALEDTYRRLRDRFANLGRREGA